MVVVRAQGRVSTRRRTVMNILLAVDGSTDPEWAVRLLEVC
jgi:hypothetical protein